jgi:hypothetical protein
MYVGRDLLLEEALLRSVHCCIIGRLTQKNGADRCFLVHCGRPDTNRGSLPTWNKPVINGRKTPAESKLLCN